MNTFTKIKLNRLEYEKFSDEIKIFISEQDSLFDCQDFTATGLGTEYLYFDEILGRAKYHTSELGDLFFDFEEELAYHRKQKYSLSKEPLAKALGLTIKRDRIIWDTTCGTGKDALLMMHFGAKVIAFERHPLIYLLLMDAERIAKTKIQFIFGDPSLIETKHLLPPETIYYDPMYPEKKKSALPRKSMQIFKSIIGADVDSEKFLAWCRTKSLDRIVVKRPIHAPKINEHTTACYGGKSTRYDMYKIHLPKN